MNRSEAQELLPWFVAGSLPEEEHRAVQAFIDSGEISAEELQEVSLFSETVAEPAADEPAYDPKILNRAMAQLDTVVQEQAEEPVIVAESTAGGPGWLAKLASAIGWDRTPAFSKIALGAQFAAVLALALMIAMPSNEPGEASYQTVSGPGVVTQASLSVAFAAGVSEAEMRGLLQSASATIVDGPNSLGMYQIALPEGADVAQVRAQLSGSGLTTFVQPVAAP